MTNAGGAFVPNGTHTTADVPRFFALFRMTNWVAVDGLRIGVKIIM
jgi:hypothetical protein